MNIRDVFSAEMCAQHSQVPLMNDIEKKTLMLYFSPFNHTMTCEPWQQHKQQSPWCEAVKAQLGA